MSVFVTSTERRRPDWVMLGAAFALTMIGALLVWAATREHPELNGGNPQSYLVRHLVNAAVASVFLAVVMRLDPRQLRLFGPVIYAASIFGLLLVFAVGSTINGAHAWIRLPGFEVQPAEFVKLGLVVSLAVMFTARAVGRRDDAPPSSTDVLIALGMIALPLGLIALQPDLGSAMVVAAAAFGVLVVAGVRARWTVGLLVAGLVLAWVAVKSGMLAAYQLDRFAAFTDPGHDPKGAAYNIIQARIAVANGGFFGTGLFHGPQTSGGFVPEQQTDFVFSVAGEELGYAGSLLIVLLFGLLCWRGVRIAVRADRTGRVIASGIVCWFGFQAFQNIGMNLGLTPITGLPLPFVSYGGSSMIAQAMALGLLQAIHLRGGRPPRSARPGTGWSVAPADPVGTALR